MGSYNTSRGNNALFVSPQYGIFNLILLFPVVVHGIKEPACDQQNLGVSPPSTDSRRVVVSYKRK